MTSRLCTCLQSRSTLRIQRRHLHGGQRPSGFLTSAQERVNKWVEHTRELARIRGKELSVATRARLAQLGSELNRVTGYEEIDGLKRQVSRQESLINEARRAAREAKARYEQAVAQRTQSQRDVNDLLQRKSNWTDGDVGRFTDLVRRDHLYEQEENGAKADVLATEDAVEKEFSTLMRSILARYHEEQIWSDKIRSASTYGQLFVLGLNMVVFLTAIVFVEPWKRRRLAQTFERKVEELNAETKALVGEGTKSIERELEGHVSRLANEIAAIGNEERREQAVPVENYEDRIIYSGGGLVIGVLLGWLTRG